MLKDTSRMGLAQYTVVERGAHWGILHDGSVEGEYLSKESAFEAAVTVAAVAIREGHEVHVNVPGHEAGDGTALGTVPDK